RPLTKSQAAVPIYESCGSVDDAGIRAEKVRGPGPVGGPGLYVRWVPAGAMLQKGNIGRC
ncbi:MAG: hypothetical protein D6706_21265, partial [Chloroflexi bacterium]